MPPHYCSACGWPVEYCQFRSRKLQEDFGCEAALKAESEEEWRRYWLRGAAEAADAAETTAVVETAEAADAAAEGAVEGVTEAPVEDANEGAADGAGGVDGASGAAPLPGPAGDQEGEEESEEEVPVANTGFKYDKAVVPPFGTPVKPFERRKADRPKILQIRQVNRGGRKCATQIYNLEDFPVDQTAYMAALRKSCAAAVGPSTAGPNMAEVVVLQGSFREEAAAEAVRMGVPRDCIYFAPSANFKGRKRK